MSQSSLQTQCPKCKTRFRVTDEQLAVANGKVRCGHCMEIFNAPEHQIPAPGQTGQPAPPSPSTEPARHSGSDDGDDDDLIFADNPEEDAAEGRYAGTLRLSEDELSESFLSLDQNRNPAFRDATADADEAKEQEAVDESWAEAMLREDEEPAAAADQEAEPAPEADTGPAAPAGPETDAGTQPPHEELSLSAQPEDRAGTAPAGARPEPQPETSTGPAAEPASQESPPAQADSPPIRATVPFSDLRREPVSVEYVRHSRRRTWLWSLVVIALAATLVAQVGWFQFDRLSAIPELRPFYEKACELTGCQLSPLVDVSAIQSRKLVVRTNPDNRSQLLVDAVIINRAAFEQPFPAIALTFSNLDGDVVAQSIFTPEEYLAGDARNLTSMPTGMPVRIAIAIRDPGRDAVNYNLDFRPHPP